MLSIKLTTLVSVVVAVAVVVGNVGTVVVKADDNVEATLVIAFIVEYIDMVVKN